MHVYNAWLRLSYMKNLHSCIFALKRCLPGVYLCACDACNVCKITEFYVYAEAYVFSAGRVGVWFFGILKLVYLLF
jgi:hypothetical protein